MTSRSLCWLAWRHSAGSQRHGVVAFLGLSLGVFILATTLALGLGVRQWILTQVVRALPVDMVEALPRSVDLGFIQLPGSGVLGGRALDAEALATLAQANGVGAAYPKLDVALPLGAQGGSRLLGHNIYVDLLLTALPEGLVRDAQCPGFVDVWAPGHSNPTGPIPVVIAPQLIDLFNSAMAPALGVPQLTAQALIGLEFDLIIGRSIVLGGRGARRQGIQRAKIVGTSPFAARLGATIPLHAARFLQQAYGTESASPGPERYSGILLRARSPGDIVAVSDAVLAQGFALDTVAQQVRQLLAMSTAAIACIGLLVLALATVQTAFGLHIYVSQRRREFALLRALGMPRLHVTALVLIQALGVGVAGGFFGLACAWGLGTGVDSALHHLWPRWPLLPTPLFAFPWALLGTCVLAAPLAALAGTVGPVRTTGGRYPGSDL